MQYKIFKLSEHGLALNQIDHHAVAIMEQLRNAGFTAYLVGGSVRDLLLQKKPKDFDISTSASPEQIKGLFRNCILIGRRFRLAHIRFGKKIFEVSTFRSGEPDSDALIVRDNQWGTEEEDVLRRDFTINGLFYNGSDQTIIDYVDGYRDLQKKTLKTIGQPHLRFKQDPVRMIRLLKFQARFGFDVDPEARFALLECRHEIAKSSAARVLEEILRMLESTAATPFIRLLAEHGLLQPLMPPLAGFLDLQEGEEVYAYLQEIDRILTELPSHQLDRALLLACLVFPLFQKHMLQLAMLHPKRLHLGEIQQEAYGQIHDFFSPFLHLPRRLKTTLASVLSGQHRIAPMDRKLPARLRLPKDPDFHLALQFFHIRTRVNPTLQEIASRWDHAMKRPRKKKESVE